MSTALDSYREHLTGTLLDLEDQYRALDVHDWTLPMQTELMRLMDEHLTALNMLNSYTADIASADPQARGKRTMRAYQVPREAPSHG